MKKYYSLILFAFIASVSLNAQVIFSSSFENWSGGKPTDWYGDKTNLPAANLSEVSSGAYAGSKAAQLENDTTIHKRFTTKTPIVVVNGTSYNVRFYVKGKGDIRTSLFDDRATGFGYAPYNSYISINSANWQLVSQSVLCANDFDSAQFVLSVKSTDASMNHLQIDSVTISVAQATTVSIYNIQYTTAVNGSSPLSGLPVITEGIVVAKNATNNS